MKKKEAGPNRKRWTMLTVSSTIVIITGLVLLTRLEKSDKKGRVPIIVPCGMEDNCHYPYCQYEQVCWVQEFNVAFPNGGTLHIVTGAGEPRTLVVPYGQYRKIGLTASDKGADFWCYNTEISVQMIKGAVNVWLPGVSHPKKFVGTPNLKAQSAFSVLPNSGVHANWRVQ